MHAYGFGGVEVELSEKQVQEAADRGDAGGIKYPDVTVTLSGLDGNAYAIIGAVHTGLRRSKGVEVADEWKAYAESSESYDQLLQRAMQTVDVQ